MNKNHDTDAPKTLLGHVKLEPRRLLNADFDLLGGALLLDDFVDSNADPIDNQVTVTQSGTIYSFVLDDGVWSGDDTALNISGDGTNTLLIDTSLGALSSIVMNSSTADQFDIEFGDFDFAGPLSVSNSIGSSLFGTVDQQAATTLVNSDTTLSGAETIDLQNSDNDFTLIDITNATDVSITDTDDIQLTSLEATNDATINAGGTIDVSDAVIGNDLSLTTTAGDIVDNGTIDVDGNAQFSATGVGGSITMDQLDVAGTIALNSDTSATIVNTTAVDLDVSTIGTDLSVTATTGAITDSGTITVGGDAQFTSADDAITLDNLDVTGTIGVSASTTGTIVNLGDVDLSLSTTGGDLTVTSTGGSITDSGLITVGGDACFISNDAITLDTLSVAGMIGLDVVNDASITNATAIDFKATTVGGNLDATATTGDVTDSDVVMVSGEASFESTAAIDLDQLDVTGSIGLVAATSATIVNTTAVDLKASNVGTDLDVTATTGDITDSAAIIVGGDACFESIAGAIDLDQLDVTGSIGLVAATSATIVNTTAVDLKASNVGTDLDVTATTGDITDSAAIIVGGDACFESIAGAIDLDQLDVTGSIGLVAATSATIVNTTAVDLKASNVGTDLDVTATTGDITDSDTVTVSGETSFNAIAGSIDTDQLDVTGPIGLNAFGSASIVNTTAVDLNASNVGTDLNVTATTGDVTDNAAIIVGGEASFESTAAAIDLDLLDVTGSIGLIAATSATIVNTTAVDLKASNVGTDLDVTATTGDITDSAAIIVGGDACFESIAGAIDLDQLDVTGSIGLVAATSATVVNTTAVDLKASNVGTDLDVTATTGDVTDSDTVTVGGESSFTAVAGSIDTDQLDVTGPIGLNASGSASIVNTTAVDLNASNVGTDLNVTATTGDVTDNAAVIVGGDACFESTAGAIDLDLLDVTGSIGLIAATSATVVNTTTIDLKASNVGTDLDVTASTGDITDSDTVTVGGETSLNAVAGSIDTDQLDVTGSIGLEAFGSASIVNTTAVDLNASNVGTDLNVTATTGDVTDNAAVNVGGDACFEATADSIILDQVIAGGSIGLVAGQDATFTADAIDFKTTNVSGNLFATATVGNITQSQTVTVDGTSSLSAIGSICLTDPGNDFDGAVTATGVEVEIVDRDDLTTGIITATDNIFLRSGATDTGGLTLTGNLTTTAVAGQTLLQSDDGVLQTGGVISTAQLLLGGNSADEGSGSFELTQSNLIGILAADVDGTIDVVNATAIVVDSLSYSSATCGTTEAIAGLDVLTKIRLRAQGGSAITLNQSISSDTIFLESTNGITQAATATITATNLMLSGTGIFDLNDAANNVDNLAAAIVGDLDYFDNDDVTVAELDCDGVTVCGLNISGNLNLTTNNGSLFQDADAAVIVAGDTTIDTGTGDICLTGGDCTGDLINDNLFGGTLTLVSSGDIVIAENDDISIDSVTGGGSIRFIGNNIQINTAITANQLLLEASDGVDYNNNLIDVNELLLRGQGVFDFGNVGDTVNSIDSLAADIDGNLNLLNGVNTDIGDLTFVSGCGDVTICGVNVDANGLLLGDVNLQLVNADLTQSASFTVEGTTTLNTGTGDICLTGGSCTGGVSNENDLNIVIVELADDASIVDTNSFTVTSATVSSQLQLFAGDTAVGDLTIAGNLTAPEQILLQSSGNTLQIAGIISTTDLLLGSNADTDADGGNFTLANANQVSNLAAFIAGDLVINNISSLDIADLTFANDCGVNQTICGVDVGGDLDLTLGGLAIANLTQSASIRVAGDADLTTTGTICLTGADCLTLPGLGNDNDFVGTVTAQASTVEIVDINDLTVGDITATNDVRLESGNGDGDGSGNDMIDGGEILQSGSLTINGDIIVSAAGSQVLLQSDGSITQAGTSVIDADELIVMSTRESTSVGGNFNLVGENQVDRIAGDVGLDGQNFSDAQTADNFGDTSLTFNNLRSIEIADLAYASACGTSVAACGLTVDGNLTMNIGTAAVATISQSAPVRVSGDAVLNATSSICLTGGDCAALPGIGNDNDFVGIVSATATTVEIYDINDLIIGDITATNDIRLIAGDGDGDADFSGVIDGAEVLQSGQLDLRGAITTTSLTGQILLQADNGAIQNIASVITTNDLLLLATHEATSLVGDFNLTGNNVVNRLAADLGFDGQSMADALNGGVDTFGDVALSLTNTINLEIADLSYVSVCSAAAICGVNVDGGLTLNIDGNLTQSASVRVTGDADLTATGIICLTGADCAALPGLGNDNDFAGTVTASATTVEIVDINALTVGDITAVDDVRLVAGDGNGDGDLSGVIDGAEIAQTGALTLNGNITAAAGQVLLETDGGIVQNAGVGITTNDLLVFTNLEATSIGGAVDLVGTNDINRLAASIGLDGQTFAQSQGFDPFGQTNFTLVNTSSLELADLAYASACGTNVALCGLDVDGNLSLDITGDLTQTASIRVTGSSTLTSTLSICLTGGSCDPAVANQNDFVGSVSAAATTVELVDINDLVIGDVTAVDDIRLTSGDGNGDLSGNDIIDGTEVLQSGQLQINGAVSVSNPAGQILLQSDGGIVQNAASVITANDLLVDVRHESTSLGGDVNLIGDNAVNRLAADIAMDGQTLAAAGGLITDNFGDSNFTFNNVVVLDIADLDYESSCGTDVEICGVSVDGNFTLSNDGDVTQSASVRVTGNALLTSTATICLTAGDCALLPGIGNDNDFVGTVTASGTTVEIVDINSLTVGDIVATDDIYLRAGDGEAGTLSLTGDLSTSAIDGQVLLQSDTAISQIAGNSITTNDLLIGSETIADALTASVTLNGENAVARLSVRLDGNFTMINTIDLEVAELTYDSSCGTSETVCGLDLQGGNLALTLVDASLSQSAAVTVSGTTLLRVLDGADGNTTADGDICLTGGECSDLPTVGNDNDFVGAILAIGRTVEIVDINDLNIFAILATDDIRLESGSFAGATQTGAINLNGNLTTTGGQVLLQSDGGINQLAGSVITAQDLLLQSTTDADSVVGDFNLIGNNQVQRLAGVVDVSLTIENRQNLEIANLNYTSNCGTAQMIAGLNVGQNWNAYVDGNLTQTEVVTINGATTLAASGNIVLFDPTNDFVGTVNVNQAADLLAGGLVAFGNHVEIQDANMLTVDDADAVLGIHLQSGDSMQLDGRIAASQVLLQSTNGVAQNPAGQIVANQLMVGGDLAAEGIGQFILDSAGNDVNVLTALLSDGSLQLRNNGNLTILASASHIGADGFASETLSGISITDANAVTEDFNLAPTFADPNITLADTIQGTAGNVDQRFNPSGDFTNFLNITDVGLAVFNSGTLATQAGASVSVFDADIYLETNFGGNLSVADLVSVSDNSNRIVAIAGGDLAMVGGGRFTRGASGLVNTEFVDLILRNPGIDSDTNAQVDATLLNQKLEFLAGTPFEQLFHSTVFWGIAGPENNLFDLPSLNAAQLTALTDLLFNAMPLDTNFESRSFYGAPFDGIADGIPDEVTSQPLGDIFDNSGKTPDAPQPTASFRLNFLTTNAEFRNVQVMFNDAGINIFENNDTALTDLNVATADFQGLARIGIPPVIETERTEFQLPERIEITRTETVDFFQSTATEEPIVLVQNVSENFVIVVYFESQYSADVFEDSFEELAGENETGEIDYEQVQKLLKLKGLDALEWNSANEDSSPDVNRIREILERAKLDLDTEDDENWAEEYRKWLRESKGESSPEVPRGVYKIIEVDNGKAVIQGEDVDRRFVPEPSNDQDVKDYPFVPKAEQKDEAPAGDTDGKTSLRWDQSSEANPSSRVARWAAMLEGDSASMTQHDTASDLTSTNDDNLVTAVPAVAAASTLSVLASLIKRKSNQSPADGVVVETNDLDSLESQKAQNPSRNIFSRAARFLRRTNSRINNNTND